MCFACYGSDFFIHLPTLEMSKKFDILYALRTLNNDFIMVRQSYGGHKALLLFGHINGFLPF